MYIIYRARFSLLFWHSNPRPAPGQHHQCRTHVHLTYISFMPTWWTGTLYSCTLFLYSCVITSAIIHKYMFTMFYLYETLIIVNVIKEYYHNVTTEDQRVPGSKHSWSCALGRLAGTCRDYAHTDTYMENAKGIMLEKIRVKNLPHVAQDVSGRSAEAVEVRSRCRTKTTRANNRHQDVGADDNPRCADDRGPLAWWREINSHISSYLHTES